MTIINVGIASNNDPNKFHDELCDLITDYESGGLIVEVQYQMSNGIYSAVIIGRSVA